MDVYSSLTSWSLFAAGVGACCWYYWPEGQQPKRTAQRDDKPQNSGKKAKNDGEGRGRSIRRLTSEDALGGAEKVPNLSEMAARKRKQAQTQAAKKADQQPTPPQVVVEDEGETEADRQWAQRMAQTQKGAELGRSTKKEKKIKTVKQSSAVNTPEIKAQTSPHAGSEADDDQSPVATPMLDSGDVNDMLEPVASGPSVLRVTGSSKPQKEKAQKKAKDEGETKKQRQNRQKVEERRIQREAEEKDRKALEEKQRRSAREARGEPAKNGIPIAKAPAKSPWKPESQSADSTDAATTPQANGENHQPLLDTFDAESSASDVGPSTTATSTTDGEQAGPSYEDQIAQAKRNSEDDGWTTVAVPKKSKKPAEEAASSKPAVSNKTNVPKAAPAVNGKPKGFQALYVPEESTSGADPNDPSNWDA